MSEQSAENDAALVAVSQPETEETGQTYPAGHGFTPGKFSGGCRVMLARYPCNWSRDEHDPDLPPVDVDVFGYRRGRFAPCLREAAAMGELSGHLVYGFNGSEVLCDCREGGWIGRQEYADHLERILAARAAQGSDLAAKVAALADEFEANGNSRELGDPTDAAWFKVAGLLRALLADPADTGDGSGT